MGDSSPIALVVPIITSAGFGVAVKSIIDGIRMARRGVSGREDKRRSDIVAQRDHAIARMEAAEAAADKQEALADAEAGRRRRWQEYAARLRLRLVELGQDPGAWLDDTDNPTDRKEPT